MRSVPSIKSTIDSLKTELKNENIYGDKWLLIYEATFNGWITGLKSKLNESKFLKSMYDNEHGFYLSPIS